MDDALSWQEIHSSLIQACGIFDLYRSRRRNRSREGDFYLLRARNWVNVVPVLPGPDGVRFLMVRQYRQGIEGVTVEFPAGLVEEGEKPDRAAARELLEETGCRARLVPIGTIAPNPAFMDNLCYSFLAEDLQRVAEPSLDELELLEVVEVPAAILEQAIGTAPFLNSMTALAYFWYLRSRDGRRPPTGR
jgi:ADP-ribose pyrophosphatase